MTPGQYIQYNTKEAQILAMHAFTVDLLIFPSRIVFSVARYGFEQRAKPSINEKKFGRVRIVSGTPEKKLIWKKNK